MLDFSSLEKALGSLEKSLKYCKSKAAKEDYELFVQFQRSAIKAFEYSYETSLKMLKRCLEQVFAETDIDKISFKELLRIAAEKELVASQQDWLEYREKRNITSHTYDIDKADEVYKVLPRFLVSAKELLVKMKAVQ